MLTARETTALVIAIAADALQIVLFPLFGEGVLSPMDDCLDMAMFLILFKLLGWHPILLPTIAAELIPVVDVCPTWTLAVLIIVWRKRKGKFQTLDSRHLPKLPSTSPPEPISIAAPNEPN